MKLSLKVHHFFNFFFMCLHASKTVLILVNLNNTKGFFVYELIVDAAPQ